MTFTEPPPTAAWRHVEARHGFEVAWFDRYGAGRRLRGHSTGLEDGRTWSVAYDIRVDADWCTRHASVTELSPTGAASTELESDGAGSWWVDGVPAPELDGCLDVDLEASGMTNTLPVHRLALEPGAAAQTSAVYVRLGTATERLDQTYRRADTDGRPFRLEYSAPAFDFTCTITFDRAGLVVDYPGIAVRVG
jgi:uncharacterized protein